MIIIYFLLNNIFIITFIFFVVNEVKIYSLKKEDGSIENIDDSCILGTYKATIPFAGTILGFLLSRQGFLIITLIPACILFVLFLVNFLLSLRKKTQQ